MCSHASQSSVNPDGANSGLRKPVIGVVIFPGFEVLDVFGPLEFFNMTSLSVDLSVITIGPTTGPISSRYPDSKGFDGTGKIVSYSHMSSQTVVAKYSFDNAPHVDILLVPGGLGIRHMEDKGDTCIQDFVRSRYPSLEYLLSVCNGAIALAKTGLLDGKKATSNKALWAWALEAGPKVDWQPSARWVEDGNIWTSSGVSAGMDMTYAFIRHYWSKTPGVAVRTANGVEYAPHTDKDWDPFSVIHNVPGANHNHSLIDCIGPATE